VAIVTTTTPSEIRQSIASTLSALTGWTESRWVYDFMAYDPNTEIHRTFAIGVGATDPTPPTGGRRISVVEAETEILVRYLWRIRGDAAADDYGAALDAGDGLLVAIHADWPEFTHVIFRGVLPRFVPVELEGRYFVGEIRLGVKHAYALT
jgi:hypothetical protein|tara:strand:+ start:7009 stop:7461 length:453 start_codon:yes stop_codon:yes gene_type:complete